MLIGTSKRRLHEISKNYYTKLIIANGEKSNTDLLIRVRPNLKLNQGKCIRDKVLAKISISKNYLIVL